jgi:hypothetical protein
MARLWAALLLLVGLVVAGMAGVVLDVGRSQAYDCTDDYSTAVAAGTVVVVLVGAVVLVVGLATGRGQLVRAAAITELTAIALWLIVGGGRLVRLRDGRLTALRQWTPSCCER